MMDDLRPASVAGLGAKFAPPSAFHSPTPYILLPFRFLPLDDDRQRYIVTNLVGEYVVAQRSDIEALVSRTLRPENPAYDSFASIHILTAPENLQSTQDLLALKERTRHSNLPNFTGLHIFVVTLRCDYSCPYCQVSRQTEDADQYDMTRDTADKALALVFESPSPTIKIEFQGGEPLLNFNLIKHIVEGAETRNRSANRELKFVIATNLSVIDDAILDFCVLHEISISTSLDGPEPLHNRNRPRPGKNGHELTVKGIHSAQRRLGAGHVAAIMTTTESSLLKPKEIIDEYIALGMDTIFLRPLSPYGFAIKTRQYDRYCTEAWLDFYKEGLSYILQLNREGVGIQEFFATLCLRRLLTPLPTGYVDLQSPAGIGIAALVFNYDGDVYPSDESRMLVEMGDTNFRLGNVHDNTYEEIIGCDALLAPLEASFLDSVPICDRCAFNPVCGADPVYHFATQRDWIGNKATSGFCLRNMGVFKHLVHLLEDDPDAACVLRSWAWLH